MNDLVAGRELDALIAEKVMGWRNVAVVPGTGEPWGIAETAFPSQHGSNPVPEYSTDIAAAWQIVEKADEAEMWNHTGKVWGCRLIFRDRDGQAVQCTTAPLAICRAALAAIDA